MRFRTGLSRLADPDPIVKILIVAPAWVGDMVMAHSLIRTLNRQRETSIDLLAPPASAPLGQRMPGIRSTHLLDVGHGEFGWQKRRTLARQLKAEAYDQAIVLPNSFKSALIPFWAGIQRRTGWTGESRHLVLNDRRHLDKSAYPLMIERFMALGLPAGQTLAQPYPLPQLTADADRARQLREEHRLSRGAITVLCPGAEFGPAKRWPPAHYAALARHEVQSAREVWLLGSPADLTACQEIEQQVPTGLVNLAGRTSLLDAVDLISLAERVVCNDSGLMHIAAALDRQVVAVYGSTSERFTPPLGERAQVVKLGLACSPCFERTCPLGHLRCLNDLEPQRVIEVL